MEVMNLYIDADSLLYRASHLADRPDKAQAEAEAIGENYGIYLVWTIEGGIPERPTIEHTNEERIEAYSKKEAEATYKKKHKVEYWTVDSELVEKLEDDAEDIDLETADAGNHLINMSLTFHSMVNEIEKEVFADAEAKGYKIAETILVITVKPKLECCAGLADNFRYATMQAVEDEKVKGYKANRAGMEVPDGLNDIYEYVHGLKNTVCPSGIEADDYVVHYGQLGHIVAALDKDVLGSLDYAYNYGKKEWIQNDLIDIKKFPYLQTIMGDSSDGLRGVFRVGAKGAEKALEGLESEYDMWVATIKQYYLKNQTLEEAVATMKCVRMDMWTPEKGLVEWTPPTKGTP